MWSVCAQEHGLCHPGNNSGDHEFQKRSYVGHFWVCQVVSEMQAGPQNVGVPGIIKGSSSNSLVQQTKPYVMVGLPKSTLVLTSPGGLLNLPYCLAPGSLHKLLPPSDFSPPPYWHENPYVSFMSQCEHTSSRKTSQISPKWLCCPSHELPWHSEYTPVVVLVTLYLVSVYLSTASPRLDCQLLEGRGTSSITVSPEANAVPGNKRCPIYAGHPQQG